MSTRVPPRWDYSLGLFGAAISVIVAMFPRSRQTVCGGLILIALLLAHPAWSIAKRIRLGGAHLRSWTAAVVASLLLAAVVAAVGRFAWHSLDEGTPPWVDALASRLQRANPDDIAKAVTKRLPPSQINNVGSSTVSSTRPLPAALVPEPLLFEATTLADRRVVPGQEQYALVIQPEILAMPNPLYLDRFSSSDDVLPYILEGAIAPTQCTITNHSTHTLVNVKLPLTLIYQPFTSRDGKPIADPPPVKSRTFHLILPRLDPGPRAGIRFYAANPWATSYVVILRVGHRGSCELVGHGEGRLPVAVSIAAGSDAVSLIPPMRVSAPRSPG